MNARERLEIMVRTDRGSMTVWSPAEVRDALDAYRAEGLNEAADDLVAFCPDHGNRDTSFIDCHCPAADDLRRMADARRNTASSGESTQPADFFQPGHTYRKTLTVSTWLYRCERITTDPNNGERISLGWHRRQEDDNPAWFPKLPLRQDEWDSGKWAEATDGGDAR